MKIRATIVFFVSLFLVLSAVHPSEARPKHHRAKHATAMDANGSQVIGGRPEGCPRKYCGCGLRKYLGIDDVRLDLAANWLRHYKGDKMIAVWRHHVALIEQWLGNGKAVMRDYNSGRGLSRIHVRSIAGAKIVNKQYAGL